MAVMLLRPILQQSSSCIPRQLVNPHRQLATQLKQLKDSKGREVKTTQTNSALQTYYAAQETCQDIEELMTACRKGLPTVFRVIPGRPESTHLRKKLEEGFLNVAEGIKITWYPGKQSSVWKMGKNTRWDIKSAPELAKMDKFLQEQFRAGRIYRQEQVSMVPVACLDIQPHHRVLDMCASPGSKTGQVIEALHSGSSPPTGFVIACEPDRERCANLAGNIKLLPSPCRLAVSDEGQTFPEIWDSTGGVVRFDRIVCDVPCSGDGTIRKNPGVWESWSPASGNHRHSLQLNIARRGVELLKEGGLMAYSSCSMNQVENEAVVAALLQEAKGNLELVDMTGQLPGLHWLPGLFKWRVHDGNMQEYESYKSVPENLQPQLPPTVFPPSPHSVSSLNLHRCMRFLPNLNDDGGFFVAILKKTGPVEEKQARGRWRRVEGKRGIWGKERHNKKCQKLNQLLSTTDDLLFELPEDVEATCIELGLKVDQDNLVALGKQGGVVHLVSPALRDILHHSNRHLKFAGSPGMRLLKRWSDFVIIELNTHQFTNWQFTAIHRNALGRKKSGEKPFSPCGSTFHTLLPHIGDKKKVCLEFR